MSQLNSFGRLSRVYEHAALALTALLSILFLIFAVASLRWPWMNDAQVFHYVVFLIGRGLSPYRQIIDINLPGSYVSEWIGMHLAADTDLSYRLYDLGLLLALTAATTVIAKPYHWFAGVFAGLLFALIHGSEGPWMLGERDFVMAVLLLWAHAFAFLAVRQRRAAWLFAASLAVACAATLKPFALLYACALLPLACRRHLSASRDYERALKKAIIAVSAGFAFTFLALLAALLWRQSLSALLSRSIALAGLYRSLHESDFAYMLHHSTPRGLYFLLPPGIYLAWHNKWWRDWQRLSLQIGILLGLFSYALQGRGFVYHRYPWVAFALLWLAIEAAVVLYPAPLVSEINTQPTRTSRFGMHRMLALAILLVGSLVIAPFYLTRVFTVASGNDFALTLVDDMRHLAHTQPQLALDGHVQCLDGVAGCYSALYRLGLQQSTGVMGDQLFFQDTATAAVSQYRSSFLQVIADDPPAVFIETNYWYGGPQSFAKTSAWPAFDQWLHMHYILYLQRNFPMRPDEQEPIGYQIYLYKS